MTQKTDDCILTVEVSKFEFPFDKLTRRPVFIQILSNDDLQPPVRSAEECVFAGTIAVWRQVYMTTFAHKTRLNTEASATIF
jgi:hypothetical protein